MVIAAGKQYTLNQYEQTSHPGRSGKSMTFFADQSALLSLLCSFLLILMALLTECNLSLDVEPAYFSFCKVFAVFAMHDIQP